MRGGVAGGLGAALLAIALAPRSALACSYSIPPPIERDRTLPGIDVTPPVLLAVRVSGLERGIPGNDGGCLTHSFLSLQADASDDLTPPEELVYRVEELPDHTPFFYDGLVADMYYIWEEEPTEPLDLELRVRAVDQAGNESEPVDIRITDGTDASGGCSLARASGGADLLPAWLSVLAGMSLRLRRRRRPVAFAAQSSQV